MTNERCERVHGLWAAVADRWSEHADYVETRAAEINTALLDGAGVGADDRVLELASGPGGLGLAAAAYADEVVISDVVPRMAEIAAERADLAGVRNVATKVLDLEAIDEPDDSFDVVLVREGLMFAVEPANAVAEMFRVLRPSGRVGVSVWGPRAANPWLGLVMDGAAAQLGHEVPPPGMPGPFSLSDGDALAALFRAGGFSSVELTQAAAPLRAPSFEDWWQRTTALAGPLAGVLAMLPDDAKTELEARVRNSAGPYVTSEGLEFPGLVHVLTATA